MKNQPYTVIGIAIVALLLLSLASCTQRRTEDAENTVVRQTPFRARVVATSAIIPLVIPVSFANVYKPGDTLQAIRRGNTQLYEIRTSTKPEDGKVTSSKIEENVAWVRVILE